MRSSHLFLVGYFVLLLGVGLGLWKVGLLDHVSPTWMVIGVLVAAGAGIMTSASTGKPTAVVEETIHH